LAPPGEYDGNDRRVVASAMQAVAAITAATCFIAVVIIFNLSLDHVLDGCARWRHLADTMG